MAAVGIKALMQFSRLPGSSRNSNNRGRDERENVAARICVGNILCGGGERQNESSTTTPLEILFFQSDASRGTKASPIIDHGKVAPTSTEIQS